MWWASSPTVHRDGDGKREQAWSIVLWRRHKAGLSVPVVFHMDDSPVVRRQLFLPVLLPQQGMLPNSRNLVSRSNQDQLGSVASLKGRFVGTGIDQMLGHDATPVLHPALEGSQLSITEPAWMGYTQPGEQVLGGGLRMLL